MDEFPGYRLQTECYHCHENIEVFDGECVNGDMRLDNEGNPFCSEACLAEHVFLNQKAVAYDY